MLPLMNLVWLCMLLHVLGRLALLHGVTNVSSVLRRRCCIIVLHSALCSATTWAVLPVLCDTCTVNACCWTAKAELLFVGGVCCMPGATVLYSRKRVFCARTLALPSSALCQGNCFCYIRGVPLTESGNGDAATGSHHP